jgi:iron complex outermembrane receptor protein
MNSYPTSLRSHVALWSAVLLSTVTHAQVPTGTAEEAAVELPQFNVVSTAGNQYRPTETMSVNRVAGSIIDSPFSVNVVTPELLRDLGANAMFDVTRYFGGMSPGRGSGAGGIQDRANFRGFESFSKTIDNFSSFLLPTGSGFQATFDPNFIERVELVMGPNSVLSPTGAPGGSVNVITKSPRFEAHNEISAMVGNYSAQKVSLDSTGAIGTGNKWAYRVLGSFQDTETYVPGKLKLYSGSAQLTYAISPTAKITAKYFSEQWGLYGTVATTNGNGILVATPNSVGGVELSDNPPPGFAYNGTNGNAEWNARIDRFDISQIEFTAVLFGRVNMRLAAQYLDDHQYQKLGFPRNTPSVTIDPATGQTTAVGTIDPTAIPIVGQYFDGKNTEIQFQNDYAANFDLQSVKLQAVAGWASQTGDSKNLTLVNNTSLPPANALLDYNPPIPALSTFTFSSYLPQDARLVSAYAVLRASFLHDRVFLTGGYSKTWATVNAWTQRGIFLPGVGQLGLDPSAPTYRQNFTFSNTGVALSPTAPDNQDTYLAGVLFKPLPNVSVYGSYSTNAGITANNPLWQAGKQYEVGAKAELYEKRLQLTAAYFDITQDNVSTQNPLFNTGQSTIPFTLSDQTSKGVELNVIGGLTPNLSVIGSYTDQQLRDPLGRRVRNVPDTMWNLLLNYRIREGSLKNLSGFFAISHLGNVAGETRSGVTAQGVPQQPGFFVAPWTVFNAGAGYTHERYRFSLNVDNVFDQRFWWQPASRISVSPYPGRTVRLTTTISF